MFDTRTETAIANTLVTIKLRGTIGDKALTRYNKFITLLASKCNLFNTTETTLHILNMKGTKKKLKGKELTKGYIKRILNAYTLFCQTNKIQYDKPKIKYEPPVPIIPTTEQVHDIINTAEGKYAFIFTLLSETAIEQEELHRIPMNRIDREQATISVIGTKGHANGNYKLKTRTADMLRQYIAKHLTDEYPFPTPQAMSQAWISARKRASTKLCKPDLNTVQLKSLRNYAGAQFYKTTGKHDPIATMRFMRHKKLETTLWYIRSITLDEPEEYKTETVKLGEPDTLKRIVELSNAGYTKFTEADGYQYFRIPKPFN
jgi:integrase